MDVSDQITVLIPSQLIDIPAGWSGISSYITPFDPNIVHVTEPCKDKIIVQVSIGGVYWPEQNVNTMISWSPAIGYKVKYDQPCCLPIFGSPVTWPSTVHLNVGVNYIPVHSPTPIMLTDVFGADTTKIILLVDIYTVQVYNPGFGIFNTLEYLEPGISYLAYMAQSTNITYPEPTKSATSGTYVSKREPFQVSNRTNWNGITNTGSMHVMSFEKFALAGIEPGDYIGAFDNNGTCVGMSEFNGGDRLVMSVFADDQFTSEKEGMSESELISYRLYRNYSGDVYDLKVSYDPTAPNFNGLFASYGLSRIINATTGTTSVVTPEFDKVVIFPTPATDYLIVRATTGIQQIRFVNHFGQQIAMERMNNTMEYKLDVSSYSRGVYIIEVKSGSGAGTTQRIILQ